jgi:hypothetical protein
MSIIYLEYKDINKHDGIVKIQNWDGKEKSLK